MMTHFTERDDFDKQKNQNKYVQLCLIGSGSYGKVFLLLDTDKNVIKCKKTLLLLEEESKNDKEH
jgi:hypothetical protein